MLKVTNLSFSYGSHQILQDVSFKIKKGDIATLIGLSGSGKTTIFKLLTGLLTPQNGTILIDSQPLPHEHGKISYLMQEEMLLPWRTVLKNLTLVSELGKSQCPRDHQKVKAMRLLEELEMPDCAHLYPDELSGGMRQRVSLAQALLQNRPLLLLDEPFGPLDVSLREQMYALLRQIQSKYGTTMLMVTHDFHDALSLSDHIFLIAQKKILKEWNVSDHMRNDSFAKGNLLKELSHALGSTHEIMLS